VPRWVLASAAGLLLSGCRGSVVELRRPVKGPVAEVGYIDPGGAHVRYALRGAAFLVKMRRSDALKRAGRHCGGALNVKLVKEWRQDDVETPYNADDLEASLKLDLDHYRLEPYQHMQLDCVRSP
jgi:hypothetical protein